MHLTLELSGTSEATTFVISDLFIIYVNDNRQKQHNGINSIYLRKDKPKLYYTDRFMSNKIKLPVIQNNTHFLNC